MEYPNHALQAANLVVKATNIQIPPKFEGNARKNDAREVPAEVKSNIHRLRLRIVKAHADTKTKHMLKQVLGAGIGNTAPCRKCKVNV